MISEEGAARNFVRAMRKQYALAIRDKDFANAAKLSRRVDQGERRLFTLVYGDEVKPWQV